MIRYQRLSAITIFITLSSILGCSHRFSKNTENNEPIVPQAAQLENDTPSPEELDEFLSSEESKDSEAKRMSPLTNSASSSNKIHDLETKINILNDKVNSLQVSLNSYTGGSKDKTKIVSASPVQRASKDLVNESEILEKFQKNLLLFHAGKTDLASDGFKDLLENYPEHPLAPAYQFYIAENFFKKSEWQESKKNYEAILINYPQSSYISDSLLRISQSFSYLKNVKKADEYKEILLTLFPQSPASKEILNDNPSDNENVEIKKEGVKTFDLDEVPGNDSTEN